VSPNSEGAGGATAANVVEAASNPAQLIDPKQSNDLNRVAAATYQPSWIAYLLLLLGAALVAASTTIWIRHLAATRIATPENGLIDHSTEGSKEQGNGSTMPFPIETNGSLRPRKAAHAGLRSSKRLTLLTRFIRHAFGQSGFDG